MRLLPFGIPLVLLFNLVPILALIMVFRTVKQGWAWTAWDIGIALTAAQAVFWAFFIAQPFRRVQENGG